jgi:hypothetical protein
LTRIATLLAITAALLFINMIPGASALLYPIRLLVTYVHEGMHALAALMTGGSVLSIAVQPDMSGLTWTRGGIGFLITSAGYLGTLLCGAICTFGLKHGVSPKAVLAAIGGIVVMNIAYMGFGNPFGTFWGFVLCGIIGVGLASSTVAYVLAPLLSIQLLLGAFYDMQTLLALSTMGAQTDAQSMANMTGIPAVVWAVFWLGISAVVTWKLLLTGSWPKASRPARTASSWPA